MNVPPTWLTGPECAEYARTTVEKVRDAVDRKELRAYFKPWSKKARPDFLVNRWDADAWVRSWPCNIEDEATAC